ncbi:MAG: c-di-GMP-related signal transduction protein [Desulforhopalus sp.]|jgi:c-di-GMP-related signal transduction protein
METIIARQPIFNHNKRLFAYELLYRGIKSLSLENIGGERATTSLLTSAFLTEGLEKISSNKPCFINFTEELLTGNIVENFPKNKIIIEILEDVTPTPEVIAACKHLKQQGYILALDDFIFDRKLYPLIELADIIKFDVLLTPVDTIHKALHYISHYDIELLAEKVETHEEFTKAVKLGFTYFQGYFFAKPEVMRIKELATSQVHLLSLVAEINRREISTEKLTQIITADVSLSYKLLRYINSAYFYLIKEVKSITHAITYLGENEIRRFVTLVAISELASHKPPELIKLATIRAKFCEQLGLNSDWLTNPDELFLLGLFSLLDAMLDTPMEKITEGLPITEEVKLALNSQSGPLSAFLTTVISYEKGEHETYNQSLKHIEVDKQDLHVIYLDAVGYADNLVSL